MFNSRSYILLFEGFQPEKKQTRLVFKIFIKSENKYTQNIYK